MHTQYYNVYVIKHVYHVFARVHCTCVHCACDTVHAYLYMCTYAILRIIYCVSLRISVYVCAC